MASESSSSDSDDVFVHKKARVVKWSDDESSDDERAWPCHDEGVHAAGLGVRVWLAQRARAPRSEPVPAAPSGGAAGVGGAGAAVRPACISKGEHSSPFHT